MTVNIHTALHESIQHYMDTASDSAKAHMAEFLAACLVLDGRFSIVYTGDTDKKEDS